MLKYFMCISHIFLNPEMCKKARDLNIMIIVALKLAFRNERGFTVSFKLSIDAILVNC